MRVILNPSFDQQIKIKDKVRTEGTMDETKAAIKEFVLSEFLPGEDPNELTDTHPLITGGIIDSFAMIQLVHFLEERFRIHVEPHETSPEYLDTIADIAHFVHAKS
jgi:acyl carrier protein